MGLMTRVLTRCLQFHLQASQNCLYVVGLMTHVAAEMLVLVVSDLLSCNVLWWWRGGAKTQL